MVAAAHFYFARSRLAIACWIALYLLLALFLSHLAISQTVVPFIGLVMLLCMLREWRRNFANTAVKWLAIRYASEAWQVLTPANDWCEVCDLRIELQSPVLLVLVFTELASQRPHRFPVWADALPNDERKKLISLAAL